VLRAYGASVQICDPRALHRNSEELVRESTHEQMAIRLAALQLPHLYLYGSPRGTGHHSRALLRQAGLELRKISPAGHWPFLDQRTAFIEALLAFCGRLGH
jgi:pimeloyl-ACP methyl ester carboxylesterase